ncbi:hypothetical protein AAIB46_28865 [Streptomyces sp. 35M1]
MNVSTVAGTDGGKVLRVTVGVAARWPDEFITLAFDQELAY